MAGYMGTALVVNWIWTGGTLAMNTDYRSFTHTPTVQAVDDTAGADAAQSFLKGVVSTNMAFSGKMQAGSLPAWGSALVEGAAGTVIFYPEGTAAGKYRGTVPAFCNGMVSELSYNDSVNVSVSWLGNGSRAEGTS